MIVLRINGVESTCPYPGPACIVEVNGTAVTVRNGNHVGKGVVNNPFRPDAIGLLRRNAEIAFVAAMFSTDVAMLAAKVVAAAVKEQSFETKSTDKMQRRER